MNRAANLKSLKSIDDVLGIIYSGCHTCFDTGIEPPGVYTTVLVKDGLASFDCPKYESSNVIPHIYTLPIEFRLDYQVLTKLVKNIEVHSMEPQKYFGWKNSPWWLLPIYAVFMEDDKKHEISMTFGSEKLKFLIENKKVSEVPNI